MRELTAWLLATVFAVLWVLELTELPVRYMSHSSGECVRAEYKGMPAPCDSTGKKYEVVIVE